MHDPIFTGRAKTYNEAILRTLFYKEKLTCQEIARELYRIFYKTREDEKILAKEIKPINDNLSGSKGRLKDLTTKEFIQQIITKKANEHKYSGEGARYSLTRNKGYYTALRLLNNEEVDELLLIDFSIVPERFRNEVDLSVLLLDDNEDNFTNKVIYRKIRESLNSLLKSGYDLKKMSNEQFNNAVRVSWDNLISDMLLSKEVFKRLCRLSKDKRDMYLEFLEERTEYVDQMFKQTQTELDGYAKMSILIDDYKEKLKIVLKNITD